MEVRPIDANELNMDIKALAKDIARVNGGVDDVTLALKEAYDMVDDAPTLDYAPVRHGEWSDGAFENSKRCTRCGLYASKVYAPGKAVWDYIYCPYCSAKMDGKDDA